MNSILAKIIFALGLTVGATRISAQPYALEAFDLDLGGGTSVSDGFAVTGSMTTEPEPAMSGGAFGLVGEFVSLTPAASPEVEPTIIFDNTEGSANGGFGVTATTWLASRFCLGSQSYALVSISLLLNSQDFSGAAGPPSLVYLQIYASDPMTGKPSTNIGPTMTLSSHTNPVALVRGQQLVTWTNSTPFRLVDESCYWAVLSGETGKRIGQISSITKPAGDAGSFGASSSANAGATWGTPTESSNNKMLIKGIPTVNPQLLAITAVGIFGSDLLISFSTQTGRNYMIESRAEVATGAWGPISDATYVGTGSVFQTTIANALNKPHQFYRVKESP